MVSTSVRIVAGALGGSTLSRMAQDGTAPAGWYPGRPRTVEEWRGHLQGARPRQRWWDALGDALGSSSGAAAERRARVTGGQGVVVTTGQQPGLLGGPVYTWSKALSALALADALEAETGVPVAPVFWAATDDGDFAEASWTMLSRSGGADRIAIESTMPEGTRMVDVPLVGVEPCLERLAIACGSAADHRPLEFARQAYSGQATVGSAYLALLRAILEPLGITVIDAAHPAMTAAAHPVLLRALHERERVARALAGRSRDMVAAGHAPQVPDVADLTLVFERRGLRRERIPRVRAAVAAATAEPGSLSPNVLLRPVVERALLPTVGYVAGPGEIAYFAQVSAVAEGLGLDAPMAVPRWSATLVEPHVDALLSRYGVAIEDFADPHAVETRLARDAWPSGLLPAVQNLRRDLAERLAAVRAALQSLDGAAPASTVDGAARAMEWRISRMERRISAAVKSRETALMRDLGTIRGSLFPGGMRQERALNLLPLLARHGLGLLDDMKAHAAGHARALLGVATEPAVAP